MVELKLIHAGLAWCSTFCKCIARNLRASRHSLETQGFKPGESIAVFGAGPVGLMAAYSAILRVCHSTLLANFSWMTE